MARDRRSHLFFNRRPAPEAEPRETELRVRQQRLERGLAVPPERRGLDFNSYRELSQQATQNVRATVTVGQVTGRTPTDLKKIQRHIAHHEANGTLPQYVLDHPDEVVAALCSNTKRTLSMIITALDSPDHAYLQSLKNLLIADLKPTSQGGAYLDLYNAITEMMCASYNYLASCTPQAPASPAMQSDLCAQVRTRAEKFYGVLHDILSGAYPAEEIEPPSSGEGPQVITEATMKTRAVENKRIV